MENCRVRFTVGDYDCSTAPIGDGRCLILDNDHLTLGNLHEQFANEDDQVLLFYANKKSRCSVIDQINSVAKDVLESRNRKG